MKTTKAYIIGFLPLYYPLNPNKYLILLRNCQKCACDLLDSEDLMIHFKYEDTEENIGYCYWCSKFIKSHLWMEAARQV